MITNVLIGIMVVLAVLQLIVGTLSGKKMAKATDVVNTNKHGFNMLNAAITFGACLMIIKFFLLS